MHAHCVAVSSAHSGAPPSTASPAIGAPLRGKSPKTSSSVALRDLDVKKTKLIQHRGHGGPRRSADAKGLLGGPSSEEFKGGGRLFFVALSTPPSSYTLTV